ncbi:MAG: hypothetical protein JXR37_16975 [Kiritimatiellae bacterium]|nr:hypothetical protein [Kiritimatiellia bacterium]
MGPAGKRDPIGRAGAQAVGDLHAEVAARFPREALPGRVFRFLGQPVAVYSNEPAILRTIGLVYGAFETERRGEPGAIDMFVIKEDDDDGPAYRVVDPGFNSFVCRRPDDAVGFWAAQLTGNHLFKSGFLFLHGAAFRVEGRVLIFAGASRSGKTTLALKLLQRKWRCLSDELVPIDLRSGLVHPFPRALLLREDTLRRAGAWPPCKAPLHAFEDRQDMAPGEAEPPRRFIVPWRSAAGARVAEAGPVGWVVFLESAGGPCTVLAGLPAALALERLFAGTLNPGYLPPPQKAAAVDALTAMLARAPALAAQLGPLDDDPALLADSILRTLADARVRGRDALEQTRRRCHVWLRAPAE